MGGVLQGWVVGEDIQQGRYHHHATTQTEQARQQAAGHAGCQIQQEDGGGHGYGPWHSSKMVCLYGLGQERVVASPVQRAGYHVR